MRCWMNQGTTMCFNNIQKDIEYCSRYGFEAVELKYSLICNCDQIWIKELLHRNKIHVGSIGAVQLPILRDDEVKRKREDRLRDLCQYADTLHAEYIIIIPPRGVMDIEKCRIMEDAAKILERYSEIAREYNVKLALEIMGFWDSWIGTIKDGLQIVHMTKQNNIGIVYDFYHVLGMKDLGETILEVKPENIFIVHVNDGNSCIAGYYDDDNRLWPYDGVVDIGRQMSMLQRVGYQGPFSMEVYQSQGWTFDMQECYRISRNRMRMIRSLCQYN